MDLCFIIENKFNNEDYVEVIVSDFDTVRFMDYYDVCESIDDVSACSEELKKAINELGDDLQTYCWDSVLSDVETEDVFIEWEYDVFVREIEDSGLRYDWNVLLEYYSVPEIAIKTELDIIAIEKMAKDDIKFIKTVEEILQKEGFVNIRVW